ncbi:kinase-like domain-containing protein, partial [Lactarius pseudohatsudake]
FGAVSRAQLEHRADGLDYLHRSDDVQCDLKAANILTTKTGNVKLSDFGVSLNLPVRAMEREIKDVTGTPNWMTPEVIELKGASPKSDIWSLGCTAIELLTNAMTVMFRIVEDESPPTPERFSSPLVAARRCNRARSNSLSMRWRQYL